MKSSTLKKALFKFILPLAIILLLFFFKPILGAAALALGVLLLLYTGRARLYSILGTINYSKGNIEKAMQLFEKAYKTGRPHPRMAISYAYLLLKSGKTGEPEEILTQLLSSALQQDDAMLAKSNLALVLWKKGQLENAVGMLEEVIQNYKTTTVYGSLGYLLILQGNLDRALEFNLEAHEYNSGNAIILDNLGQTYYLRRDYEKASEIYGKLLATHPSFPEAYYNYGLLMMKKGENEKALEAMKKASGFRFTYLSTVTREEVEEKVEELKKIIEGAA